MRHLPQDVRLSHIRGNIQNELQVLPSKGQLQKKEKKSKETLLMPIIFLVLTCPIKKKNDIKIILKVLA